MAQINDFETVDFRFRYAPIKNIIKCYQFYGSIGYEFKLGKKLFLSPHMGLRLIEIFRDANLQNYEGVIQSRNNQNDSIVYSIWVSHFSFNSLLVNLGTQLEYRVRGNLGILLNWGLETGFKSMLTTGTKYRSYNTPMKQDVNMTYNKAESLQASIGLKWHPFKRNAVH